VAGSPERAISLSVNGCVSRSVRDTALWLSVTENTANSALQAVGLVVGASTVRRRIGVKIEALNGVEPDPQVRRATEAAAQLCERLGHTVIQTNPPINGAMFGEAFTLLWAAGAAEIVQQVRTAAPDVPIDRLLEPLTLGLAEHYARAGQGALERSIGFLRNAEAQYDAMFTDYDILLTPVLSRPPPAIGELAPTQSYDVVFPRVSSYAAYTPLQNASGAPSISLPLGQTQDGLPIGALFSARKGQEKMLLELAFELEQAQPWATRRPRVWAG
jgi:amidase